MNHSFCYSLETQGRGNISYVREYIKSDNDILGLFASFDCPSPKLNLVCWLLR